MRLIDADEITEFPYNETSGTDEQIDTWIREVFDDPDCDGIYVNDKYEDELKALCWKVIDGMLSVIETQPTYNQWHDLRENPNDLPVLEIGNEYVEVLLEDNMIPITMNFDDICNEFGYWNDIYDPVSLGYVDSEFSEWNGEDIVFWRYIEYPNVEEW